MNVWFQAAFNAAHIPNIVDFEMLLLTDLALPTQTTRNELEIHSDVWRKSATPGGELPKAANKNQSSTNKLLK